MSKGVWKSHIKNEIMQKCVDSQRISSGNFCALIFSWCSSCEEFSSVISLKAYPNFDAGMRVGYVKASSRSVGVQWWCGSYVIVVWFVVVVNSWFISQERVARWFWKGKVSSAWFLCVLVLGFDGDPIRGLCFQKGVKYHADQPQYYVRLRFLPIVKSADRWKKVIILSGNR